MGIYGTGQPKIITSASNTVYLNYVKILEDGPDFKRLEHKSKIDGDRTFYGKGFFWKYKILMHLFRYNNPRSKFEELEAALYDSVTLYRHSDGDPIKDADDNNCPFFFAESQRIYMENRFYRDGLILTFESERGVVV